MNALIVDDREFITKDLKNEVTSLYPQANCICITDSQSVLPVLEDTYVDIALLDIDMPGLNGLTLAEKLTEKQPNINIIFVTAHAEFALESYKVYASGFLVKPVSADDLKSAFENLRHQIPELTKKAQGEHYSGGALIGKNIEKYRTIRGLSREQLSDMLNINRSTIYRWESGQRVPDLITCVKLAKILEVELSGLVAEQ